MGIGFVWRGLTVTDENEYLCDVFDGWTEVPSGSTGSEPSQTRHGTINTPVHGAARVVTAEGEIGPARPEVLMPLARQLAAVMQLGRMRSTALLPLVGTVHDRTLTADAKLVKADIPLDPRKWVGGVVRWRAQWHCPDPRLFGPPITFSVPLVTAAAGAKRPQHRPFHRPAKPAGGSLVIDNPGTYEDGSPAVYVLSGGVVTAPGLLNRTTGRFLHFGFNLATGDVLDVDTQRGWAEWNNLFRSTSDGNTVGSLELLPGPNEIEALGTAGAGAPQLTVTVRPAYPMGV